MGSASWHQNTELALRLRPHAATSHLLETEENLDQSTRPGPGGLPKIHTYAAYLSPVPGRAQGERLGAAERWDGCSGGEGVELAASGRGWTKGGGGLYVKGSGIHV